MKTISKFAVAVSLVAIMPSTAAVAAPKPIEMTASELAAVQAHSYAVPLHVAFSASIATLQSLGYVDIDASKDAGTISAQTEAKGKIIYNILWGVGKKKLTQKASLLVEDAGAGQASVRLNLHVTETKSRGLFGTAFKDGKLVVTAEPYNDFFTALTGEVARRAAVSASAVATPMVVPVATTAVPAAR